MHCSYYINAGIFWQISKIYFCFGNMKNMKIFWKIRKWNKERETCNELIITKNDCKFRKLLFLRMTKSENYWSDNTSLEAHLIPILFCTGVIGFQVSVHYDFVISFPLFHICLVSLNCTLSIFYMGILHWTHIVYAYIDSILIWHRFRH